MKQVAPHIYVEDGYRGVTVGCIITSSGPVCIDSPMLPADARDWRAKIAKLSNKPVRFVVLTDAARERILGVQYLGGVAVAHDATWDRMKNLGDAFRHIPDGRAADTVVPCGQDTTEVVADLRLALPQITFAQTLVLYGDDMPIVLQHIGGVAPGNIWVHLPKPGVLFAGDLVTTGMHPQIAEADVAAWIEALGRVRGKEFPAKIIVPGRGGPCSKAALRSLVDYLSAMRSRVQALIRARRPKAETAQLAAEFLSRFPVAEPDRERTLRCIKAGLDRVYDTLKSKK
jgi:glyoxylase-like metal-dependent hydrolase (beta-lactamase superfamily II)